MLQTERKHELKPGKPTVFSELEEVAFVKCTIQMSQFGFPICEEDLRHIMKDYLLRIGRNVKEFKDSVYPGADLIKGFI